MGRFFLAEWLSAQHNDICKNDILKMTFKKWQSKNDIIKMTFQNDIPKWRSKMTFQNDIIKNDNIKNDIIKMTF